MSYQELELAVDYSVSPSLKLIVFVNTDNFTLGDSHTYEVESCQRHKVAAKFSEEKVYPGSPVSLSVSAQPGSLCGLSATDKVGCVQSLKQRSTRRFVITEKAFFEIFANLRLAFVSSSSCVI